MPFREPAHHDDPDADPEAVARSICLGQLDRAPRTAGQLLEAMRRRHVPDDVAHRVLSRLQEVGLVNDEAFATAWVESRHAVRGLSGRALERELRARGVADDTVATAVARLDAETELSTAREMVRRKLRAMASVEPAAQQRRLVAMLGRKGYSAGMAYGVVREAVKDVSATDLDDGDAAGARYAAADEDPGDEDNAADPSLVDDAGAARGVGTRWGAR